MPFYTSAVSQKVRFELHQLICENQGYMVTSSGDFRSGLRQHLFLSPGESNIHDTSPGSDDKNIYPFFIAVFHKRP